MCNRYSNAKEIKIRIGDYVITVFVKSRRYNIAPRQVVPVVAPKSDGAGFEVAEMTWGWDAPWSKGVQTLAKAETVLEKGAFQPHLHQRCLVPADGFYEFTGPKTEKVPIRFTKPDESPFLMAGFFRSPAESQAATPEFLLVTTASSESVAKYHDRMPLIVKPELYEAWFDAARFASVLADADRGELRGYAVSRALNNWRNEGEELTRAVEEQRELF
jgi:putative SOS response-associated peptidase YedK